MVRTAAPAVGRTDLDEYAIRGAARVGGGLLSAREGIDENEKTDRRMALRGFAERLEIGTTDLLVGSTLVAPHAAIRAAWVVAVHRPSERLPFSTRASGRGAIMVLSCAQM